MRRRLVSALIAMLLVGVVPGIALAQPTWWTGPSRNLLKEAQQSNRSIVLYFHHPGAAHCMRMTTLTWPMVNPDEASKYLWKQCAAGVPGDRNFFATYQVESAPTIVVLDQQKRERGRISGFVDPITLMTILDGLPNYEETLLETMSVRSDQRFDFEAVTEQGGPTAEIQDIFLQSGDLVKLVAGEGADGSCGLLLASPSAVADGEPRVAVVQIELTKLFPKLPERGFIEAHFKVGSLQGFKYGKIKFVAMTTLASGSEPPTLDDAKASTDTVNMRAIDFKDELFPLCNISTLRSVDFQKESVWLTFWVAREGRSFIMDDLHVRVVTVVKSKAASGATSDAGDATTDSLVLESAPQNVLGQNEIPTKSEADIAVDSKQPLEE